MKAFSIPSFRLLGMLLLLFALGGWLHATEVMPPKPAHHFNDYAHVVSLQVANELNSKLEQFERDTSNQLVVAIFPTMQTDSSMEDYCQRIFEAWGVGLQYKNNGAVLFIFVKEHKMRIQTGYGLEGMLPDITCERIIEDEIAPHLKQGDFDGGLTVGVNAMIAATKGEYKGTGQTVAERKRHSGGPWWMFFFNHLYLMFIILVILSHLRRRGVAYRSRGMSRPFFSGWYFTGGGGGGGGSSWGGGGGGGFSGGGGSSGGGGASGGW